MMRSGMLTVAITGMNAVPDNPGAGLAVARCLREAYGERLRIIGLGYDALDPGLHRREYCDSAHLISYPGSGADTLFARLSEIHEAERIDVLLPCLDAELPLFSRLLFERRQRVQHQVKVVIGEGIHSDAGHVRAGLLMRCTLGVDFGNVVHRSIFHHA